MIRGTVLVTGATGLIGKSLVKELLKENIGVVALVRNKEKAISFLGNETEKLTYLIGDVTTLIPERMDVDYIIHAASQTASKAFVENPVETIMTGLKGTSNLLEIARLSDIKGFLYLSTMEVYGSPSTDEKINERHSTNLDSLSVRNCYPESKRMCENLCVSYASEYKVPAKVIRLTQTFGPGVKYNDGRVFAEFARCAVEGRDIVLHTKGETKRSYLYVEDAVRAILTVLEKGTPGEAYNAANEDTYCSIYEMACLVADNCASKKINVLVEEADAEKLGYAPVLHMNLDTTKLKELGWQPTTDLLEMYRQLIKGWE